MDDSDEVVAEIGNGVDLGSVAQNSLANPPSGGSIVNGPASVPAVPEQQVQVESNQSKSLHNHVEESK